MRVRVLKAAPDTAGQSYFHLPKGTQSPLAKPLGVAQKKISATKNQL